MLNSWLEWLEEKRISLTFIIANSLLEIAVTFALRVLAFAAVGILYCAFDAKPTTTLYELAQFAHLQMFWNMSITAAGIYSILVVVIYGSFRRPRQYPSGPAAAGVLAKGEPSKS